MAATVEGAFVLLDKATEPLKKIRREAEKTDLALKKLGANLDAIGTNKQLQAFEKTERAVKNVGREANVTSRHTDRLGAAMKRTTGHTQSLKRRLGELGIALSGLGKVLMPAKFLLIGTAIGVAVQAVRALAAGAVALTPKIADLAGVAGVLPATLTGLGLAAATAKLAFSNLGKAMSGNKKALQSLTPEARQFLATLKGMHPMVQRLRTAAQRGLFPGLDDAIRQLRTLEPMLTRLLGRMGRRLGREGSLWAGLLGGAGMRRDLEVLGNQGVRIVAQLSGGMRSLFRAFVDVGVAARPFTDWFAKTIAAGAKWIEVTTHANRVNGDLGRFFERTKDSLKVWGRILLNLTRTLRNIGHASRALGDDLYKSMDRATKRWADWSGGVSGQNWLRKWFDDAREPLHAMFRLFGDLGKAIATFDLGGLTDTANALDKAVPSLKSLFEQLAKFGPILAPALEQVLRLADNLVSAKGPIPMFIGLIVKLLGLINDLLDRWRILGQAISAAFAVYGAYKLLGVLRGAQGMVTGLASKWWGVASAANAASTAQSRAASTPGMTSGSPLAGGTPVAGGRGKPGFTLADTYSTARSFGYGRIASGAATAGAGLSQLGAGAMAAGAAAGRFLWPVALLSGVLGAAQGDGGRGLSGYAQNAASGLSFGFIPSVAQEQAQNQSDADKAFQKITSQRPGAAGMQSNDPGAIGATQAGIRGLAHKRNLFLANYRASVKSDAFDKEDRAYFKQMTSRLNAEIKQRRDLLRELRQEKKARDALKDDQSRQFAGKQLRSLGGAYDIRAKKFGKERAFADTTDDVIARMRHMRTAGAKVLAQNYLEWARTTAKGNPKMMREVDRLTDNIKRRFSRMGRHVQIVNGEILTGSKAEWARVRTALADPMEKARQEVTADFTAIQQKAIGQLKAMGYTGANARNLVRAAEAGDARSQQALQHPGNPNARTGTGSTVAGSGGALTGQTRARGGRIPGMPGAGLRDTVPVGPSGVIAAPGEMIVNRHTEARVNSMLSRFGTSLSNEVAGEHRPHSAQPPVGFGYRVGGRIGYGGAGLGGGAVTSGSDGGFTGPFGSGAGFVPLTEFAKSVGLQPTSGRTNHSTNTIYGSVSDHSWGGAVDYSNGGSPTPQMDQFARFMGWRGESTTSGPEFPPSKQIIYRSMIGGNHFNHVHTALDRGYAFSASKMAEWINARKTGAPVGTFSTGGAGGAQQMAALVAPRSPLAGLPGVFAQRAGDLYAAGLTGSINKRLGAGGGAATGGSPAGVVVTGKVSTFGPPGEAAGNTASGVSSAQPGVAINPNGGDFREGRKYLGKNWRITIGGKSAILKQTDLGPAGWTGRRIDVTGAGAAQMGFSPGNFPTDATGTAELMAAMGRRVPWYGEGTTFTAKRPMMIGVGDKGPEDITVSPRTRKSLGDGTQKRPSVVIQSMTIHNSREGDIREQVKTELAQAFAQFEADVRNVGVTSEEPLL